MAREKKITVRPYVNNELKPTFRSGTADRLYPLYFRVLYDRKSTKFRAGNNLLPKHAEKGFESDTIIQRSIHLVRKIVRYEINQNPEFKLNQIGTRIRCYLTSVSDYLYFDLADELFHTLCEEFPDDEPMGWTASNFDQIDQDVRDDLAVKKIGTRANDYTVFLIGLREILDSVPKDNPTVYDWFFEGFKEEFINFYQAHSEEVFANSSWLSHVQNPVIVPPVEIFVEEMELFFKRFFNRKIALPNFSKSNDYDKKSHAFEGPY